MEKLFPYLHVIDGQGHMTSSLELKTVRGDWTEEVAEYFETDRQTLFCSTRCD